MNKKSKGSIFISLILLSLFIISSQNLLVSEPSSDIYTDIEDSLELSDNGISLNYTNIWQNASSAYRIFDDVKFDINASSFNGANSTIMQIYFNDNTVRDYQMEWVMGTQNFTYTYTPEYNAPLGFHNISFIILDNSQVQLNSQTTITNITLTSNYLLHLNATEYKRNENVYGEVIINDFGSFNFEWKITVVDNDSENLSLYNNLFNIGNDLSHFSFKIDDRFVIPDYTYYVKINISDTLSSKIAATYIPFKLQNTIPEIIDSSVQFSDEILKREVESQVDLNVTDLDPLTFPENITVNLLITNSEGEELSPIILDNNGDWTFSGTFIIDKNQPIGIYQIELEATDSYGGSGFYSHTLIIENNFPEIHDYWINGLSTQDRVSINYGEDISFTFNISDVEDTYPTYITVSLLDENGNWYNISRRYMSGFEITVRTQDLIAGVWYVYVSATDSDGDTTYLTSDFSAGPKEIRIIPDALSGSLTWIMLSLGLIFGGLIGLALAYNLLKSRMLRTLPSKEKKAIPKKKPKKEPEKKIKEKEIIAEEKEDQPKVVEPQRKIKRRLN